ncbi:MAG: hypothetical protein OIF38_12045 [Cellvibrionaceae bacterium]|nr:hypothetical protein [Cellvibrionaceae bacterium]
MYETHRHQYLSALGIDSYMPRVLLVNAPLPQACEWPEQAQPQLEVAPSAELAAPAVALQVVEPVAASGGPADAATILAGFGGGPEPAAKPKLSASTAAEPQVELPTEPAVAFKLSLWRCGPCLVIDSRDSQKALPTEKLLLSMLQAAGQALANLPRAQLIPWPMMEAGDGDQSASAARQMLGAFLESQLNEAADYCLLMGAAAQYLLPPDSLADWRQPSSYGQLLPPETLNLGRAAPKKRILLLPSLVEMLEQPQLKARAWQALRCIHEP